MTRLPEILSIPALILLVAGGFAVAAIPTQGDRAAVPPASERTAPEFCRIEFAGVSGYLASCVRSHASQLSRLPSACVVQLHDGSETRRVYDSACMAADGWASR